MNPTRSLPANTTEEEWENFWKSELKLAKSEDCKDTKMPKARIKTIMKCDPNVQMISDHCLTLFSKTCELFILDLTKRAWAISEMKNRKTLEKNDVAEAIHSSNLMDFLNDIVERPDNDSNEELNVNDDDSEISD